MLLQLSTQYELRRDGKVVVGWVSIYRNTVYLQFRGQQSDEFKIIFIQRRMNGDIYYVKNDISEGYINIEEFGITIYLVGNGRRYEEKFLIGKRK